MIFIQNRFSEAIIPRKFAAMTVAPFIFIAPGIKITDRLLRHEQIHYKQQLEMGWLFFFIWYAIEWLIRLFISSDTAYKDMSFEREAYDKQDELGYLYFRKKYSWIKYIKQ